jgi:ATP-dependent exoDNAse (exonuclease V) alpha subunit
MEDVFATPINIVCTHKTRKDVNKKWNDKLKPNNSLYFPVFADDKKYGQDMHLYSGCPMIARMNDNKDGMYMNNETFEVVDYDDDVVYLITERPNNVVELDVHSLEVAIDSIQKLFYLNYCTTIHKTQGTTIKDDFTWDWNHPDMSKKAKYTALSRGTCP